MKWASDPIQTQENTFRYLMSRVEKTRFGKDHQLNKNTTYSEFTKNVPIREYEQFIPYIDLIKNGAEDVLWPGVPLYFSKTSGTTSGIKYIPITRDSIPYHISAARDALLLYIYHSGKSSFTDKKMIFLSGSPVLENYGRIPTGRLSGIVNHYVPSYLRSNQMPTFKTNCVENWEEKVDKIVDETLKENMSLISGIPPWVQMYFDKIEERTGKKVGKVFPDFNLFVYGGVNFEPYRKKLEDSIGRNVDTIELFPASEGFIAFQDNYKEEGLLLLLNSGIFYEFIPAGDYLNGEMNRISLKDVRLGVNYVLILSTNAGLWAYNIGDTIRFVSLKPYRIVVSGRVKHFLSAFGEHVIAEEVEKAMNKVVKDLNILITDYTVAPMVTPEQGLPYHEWLVEFTETPDDLSLMEKKLDEAMTELNIYYKDLITGGILRQLKISPLQKGSFISAMKSMGKLGGQNKVPRLSNDRKFATLLDPWKTK